jgi:hypothetical protein
MSQENLVARLALQHRARGPGAQSPPQIRVRHRRLRPTARSIDRHLTRSRLGGGLHKTCGSSDCTICEPLESSYEEAGSHWFPSLDGDSTACMEGWSVRDRVRYRNLLFSSTAGFYVSQCIRDDINPLVIALRIDGGDIKPFPLFAKTEAESSDHFSIREL